MFSRGSIKSWSVVIFISLGLTSAHLAAPKKKEETTEKSPAEARLRMWKRDFPSKRSVQVSLRTAGGEGAETELADSVDGSYLGEYCAVPSGACTIEVMDARDRRSKLATVSTLLAADSFSTLLLQEGKGGVTAEILDDRPVSADYCELLVRNFHPEIATLQVDAGDDVHFKINSPDAFLQIRGLPHKRIEVRTSGAKSSGKTFQWSNEVDFTQFQRATIVLQSDTYGRIRPRVTIDGQFAKVPPPKPKSSR